MKRLIFILVVFMASCITSKNMDTIKYNPPTAGKHFLDIPKGYNFVISEVSAEYEHKYKYEDSSFIYLTTFDVTPNSENIENLGDSIYRYRFQNEELRKEVNKMLGKEVMKTLPDTFKLSGKDKNDLFWKDIKYGEISIGYVNVPKEKKEVFDKSLETFKKRRKFLINY